MFTCPIAGDRFEGCHAVLAQHDSYRALTRLPRLGEIGFPAKTPPLRRIAVLDCETTGLDPARDSIIELAIGTLVIDATGALVGLEEPVSWLQDPQAPLPETITQITELRDADLAGRSIDDDAVAALLENADLIVSWNAAFDAPFFERRFPRLARRPWGCAMREVDWHRLGLEGRAQAHILMQKGYFYEGHRAANDVWALSVLLGLSAGKHQTYASLLYSAAAKHSYRLFANKAPLAVKDQLKARGYRWNAQRKVWWRDVDLAMLSEEAAFLKALSPVIAPHEVPVDWTLRYRL